MYTMDKNIPVEGDGSSFMDAGIHENITLSKVEYNTSKNGNQFIAFYFKDANGNQVSKTEWEPKKRDDNDDISKKQENVMSRIKHICVNSKLLTEDEFTFKVNSFEELAKKVVELLESKKDKWDTTKLRVKVIYDDNNYTTLPRYTKFVWLENMEIPKDQSKIKKLPLDKFEREEADKEPDVANPYDELENNKGEDTDVSESESTEEAPF